MRSILVCVLVLTSWGGLSAQMLEDSFDFGVGALLTDNGWTAIRGGTDIEVIAPSLTYSGYPLSGQGNAARIEVGDQSVMRSFGSTTTGSVYAAFVIDASDAPDNSSYGMMAWIGPTDTTIFTRVVAFRATKDVSDKLRFGVSTNAGATWSGYDYDLGTPYLIVVSYTFNPGVDDDMVRLWVDPDLTGEEPVPTLTRTLLSEPSDLAEFVLTGESASAEPPVCTVDGVRVVDSWSKLFAGGELIFTDGFENNDTSNWD